MIPCPMACMVGKNGKDEKITYYFKEERQGPCLSGRGFRKES